MCKLASPATNVDDTFAVDGLNEINQRRTLLPDETVLVLVSIDVPLNHTSNMYSRKRGEKKSQKWTDPKHSAFITTPQIG
jgi:hypothetical protein